MILKLNDTIYDMGYELMTKQMEGASLSQAELSFINYINSNVDQQIEFLLKDINI